MKMPKQSGMKSVIIAGGAGSVVAVGIILWGWVGAPGSLTVPRIQQVILWLCPPSIYLMGVERIGLSGLALTHALIVLGNAVIYATVLFGITRVMTLIRKITRW